MDEKGCEICKEGYELGFLIKYLDDQLGCKVLTENCSLWDAERTQCSLCKFNYRLVDGMCKKHIDDCKTQVRG